jgi:hypothetical protein
MRFEFHKVPPVDPQTSWIDKPLVGVDIFYGKNNISMLMLVDSGADDCIFHTAIANKLGIDLSNAKNVNVGGVAGSKVGKLAQVEYCLQVMPSEKIKGNVIFLDNLPVPGLLGIRGFFEFFRIKFEVDRGIFEIIPAPKK